MTPGSRGEHPVVSSRRYLRALDAGGRALDEFENDHADDHRRHEAQRFGIARTERDQPGR